MPGLTEGNKSAKRLVLGFDCACSACGELAHGVWARSEDKLEVLSLHDPWAVAWRRRTLGEGAPLVPTLFKVGEVGEVRAYTG